MNNQIAALQIYLAARPAIGGWIVISRDVLAAELGIGRIELARLLAKAESKLGIQVQGERIKFIEAPKIIRKRPNRTIEQLLAVAADIVREYDNKPSRVAGV